MHGSELRLLAETSSRATAHTHPDGLPPGRCSACRWTELRLWVDAGGGYVVERAGMSCLTGEHPRVRVERTRSAEWVVEFLHLRSREGNVYLTLMARRLLTEAASGDAAVRAALDALVVVR